MRVYTEKHYQSFYEWFIDSPKAWRVLCVLLYGVMPILFGSTSVLFFLYALNGGTWLIERLIIWAFITLPFIYSTKNSIKAIKNWKIIREQTPRNLIKYFL